MLGLKLPTDPRWVNLAEENLSDILTDHAYCEQKAASSCISLIQRYPERKKMVDKLAPVVTEEWSHFIAVLAELRKRNLGLGQQRADLYVNELKKYERKGIAADEVLMDKLLVNALIEARSCERFRILSEELEDPDLRTFYRAFMISEAVHYSLFKELAEEYVDKEKVRVRWEELLEAEKNILLAMELSGRKMH